MTRVGFVFAIFALVFLIPEVPVTRGVRSSDYSLFGSASQGWGFTPSSMTIPGPTLTVTQGDLINLTLTSQDGLTHEFFVDYNGNGVVDTGEPVSPPFTGTINYQFNATTVGTFTYHCAFHPTAMRGDFTVTALSTPDVAISNLTLEKTVVGQGYPMRINMTVTNEGNVDEAFNVTTYSLGVTRQATLAGSASSGWNGTIPGPTITVNLEDTVHLTLISSDSLSHQFFVDYNGNVSPDPGEPTSPVFSGTVTYVFTATVNGTFTYYCAFHPGIMHGVFVVNATPSSSRIETQAISPPITPNETRVLTVSWNTTGVSFGNCTISAVADVVRGETNVANNVLLSTVSVHVGVPGDVSSTTPGTYDGITNLKDIAYMISLFNTKPSSPNWNPNADVNDDQVVNVKDIAIGIAYFNQHE